MAPKEQVNWTRETKLYLRVLQNLLL